MIVEPKLTKKEL